MIVYLVLMTRTGFETPVRARSSVYFKASTARSVATRTRKAYGTPAWVVSIDCEKLRPLDQAPDLVELFQESERQMLYWGAEADRYRTMMHGGNQAAFHLLPTGGEADAETNRQGRRRARKDRKRKATIPDAAAAVQENP